MSVAPAVATLSPGIDGVPVRVRLNRVFGRLLKLCYYGVSRVLLFATSMFLCSLLVPAQELPAGTALEARLSAATGSHVSRLGDPIEATVIAPVSVRGQVLVPQGSRLIGSVTNVTAIGFGIKHLTASISYSFHTLQLPGGAAIPINTQLIEVEGAKEHVDALNTVHGIHPIMSLSSTVSLYAFPLLLLNPTIGVPVWAVKSLIAPPANPEIRFPAGTELMLQLTADVSLPPRSQDFFVPAKPFSRDDLAEMEHTLKNSAQRAYMGSHPSDIVNVVLVGSRSQVDRAFQASGWSQAQRKSPMSLYRMYHALTERFGYPKAPMNTLTLNGVPSTFVRQKSLDTVQKRHHVRLWQDTRGANIWLGTAAEDDGFRFKLTHWTHSTQPDIDGERAKVVNDLAFTGCIDAAGILARAPADIVQDPRAEHPIVTDGNVALIRLDDCLHPNVMPGVETSDWDQRGRLVRTVTVLRDDLLRSNILFTSYNTLRLLAKHKTEPVTMRSKRVNAAVRGLEWLTPETTQPSNPGQ